MYSRETANPPRCLPCPKYSELQGLACKRGKPPPCIVCSPCPRLPATLSPRAPHPSPGRLSITSEEGPSCSASRAIVCRLLDLVRMAAGAGGAETGHTESKQGFVSGELLPQWLNAIPATQPHAAQGRSEQKCLFTV